MRLHRLRFSAFGSFGGTETIDFDELADAGLFLLHGPTGAGKTTILDAISFALFGTVAGVRPAGVGLRSHHGEPSTPTEVHLEVTLDGRRFRIARAPKQQRPKQRGSGWREHPATATVEEQLGGTWVARAAKPSEADPYLQELLHMGVAQFHQIVMLPQGDFARFLRANADERRLVLEELFATHRFAGLERTLHERAEADHLVVAEVEAQVHQLLVRAATIAELDAPDRDHATADAGAWLATVRATTEAHRDATAGAEADARAGHAQARAGLDQATELHERQRRVTLARAARTRLDADADAHRSDCARREAALRAAPVLPLIGQLNEAGAHLQALDAEVARHRMLLTTECPELADADAAELAEGDDALGHDLALCRDLLADERALDERDGELAALAHQLAALDEELAQLEADQLALPYERRQVADELDQARTLAIRVDDLAQQVDLLGQRHRAALERDDLVDRTETAIRAHDDATRVALDAQRDWLELFQAQLAGQAAALAAGLVDGDPCPVCGSAEHPDPAVGGPTEVTDADVEVAKQRFEAATATAGTTQQARAELESARAVATATAGPDAVATELAASLADHEHLLAAARTAADQLPSLEAHLAAVEEQSAALDEQRRERSSRRVELDKQRSGLEHVLRADRTRIDRARAGFATLTDRAERLGARRGLVATVRTHLAERDHADAAVLAAFERAEAEAVRQHFDDVTAAAASALDPEALAELGASIEAYERAAHEADIELDRPELVDAATRPPAPIDEARAIATQADLDLELATITADAARKATERLALVHTEVEAHLATLGPKFETAELSRRLSELASGNDRQVEHRMRLSTYVLAARLEQVAAAASDRLHTMSNGRFTIAHTDEAVDGRRKGGLGLRIIDAWTSTERETSTLSGGESFFTSLALALGVADVVCAENGGVALETMFIDEGFGSLDDDTLQNVMDVLDELRAGGRAIGIVSHVGDLRTRISSQLEVIKTPTGSRLRTSGVAKSATPSSSTAAA